MRLNYRPVYGRRPAKIVRIYNQPPAPGFGELEGAFTHEIAITQETDRVVHAASTRSTKGVPLFE